MVPDWLQNGVKTTEVGEQVRYNTSFLLRTTLIFFPSHREFRRWPRARGRDFLDGDGRKTGKTCLSTLPCIPAGISADSRGGNGPRAPRLYHPSRGRLSGFLRDERLYFSHDSEKYGTFVDHRGIEVACTNWTSYLKRNAVKSVARKTLFDV